MNYTLAEGMGFEPTVGFNTYNDLANRRLQPLGHPSAGRSKQYTTFARLLLVMPGAKVKSVQLNAISKPRAVAGRAIMVSYQRFTWGKSARST